MSLLDPIARQAGRLTTELQQSLRRARIEGERRVLQRQYRTALEELGERAYQLSRDGVLPADALGPEIAEVESRLMEIEAKAAEIEALEREQQGEAEAESGGPAAAAERDPSEVAFPMVTPGGQASPEPGPGPGWEAADRFFAK